MVDLSAASRLAGSDSKHQVDQNEVSWLQSAIAYLSHVRDLLSSMMELAGEVADGQAGPEDADAAFQLFKQNILRVVEGERGTFAGEPLFKELGASRGVEDPLFATTVWGADNDRIREDTTVFRALTADEHAFRSANNVVAEDLVPKTHAEKKARRQRNIFDAEFGHIRSLERAQVMLVQLENAIKQVIAIMSRFDTKAENIISASKRSKESYVVKLEELRNMRLEVLL